MSDRAAWLEARRGGVCGSDIAAILGLTPRWRTPLDVYLAKRGIVEEAEETERMRWGHALEPAVAAAYAAREGVELREPETTPLIHPSRPWHRGTPDRLLVGRARGLEIKAVGDRMRGAWGEDGTDDVPDYYLVQGLWYAALIDAGDWDWAVLIGGQELRCYRAARDLALEAVMLERAERFWVDHVLAGIPPPPLSRDGRSLARLHASPKDEIADAPELEEIVARWRALRDQESALEDERHRLETEIKRVIADRRGVRGSGWRALWSPTSATTYTATRPAGRRLSITETST